MSPPKSTNDPGGTYRKPRPDLYTILLVIALLAILVAILFLYLHMQTYNFEIKGGPPVAMIADGWGSGISDWRLASAFCFRFLS